MLYLQIGLDRNKQEEDEWYIMLYLQIGLDRNKQEDELYIM